MLYSIGGDTIISVFANNINYASIIMTYEIK
ncbi:MAG: hypothetical protein AVDCRST_MAG96-1689 [uncultured Segetibacter sp.]|uniref:Uncharacterized protein n=1 Tax=uncultured Segetibacter sp. TaxID=481133 RepID=A0A6J4SBI8_9BACT|nr:MAG: hypothetical protein AVDCRST_MAG96-1689 [uncultured Segetibacter sp.]